MLRRTVRQFRLLLSALPLLVILVSCSNPTDIVASSDQSDCDAFTEQAVGQVVAVIDANRACVADADCVTIGVSSTCFDICSQAVNTAGVAKVDMAVTEVEAGACKGFKDDGCKLIIPPCAPPESPVC